jgi:hypothetical protein
MTRRLLLALACWLGVALPAHAAIALVSGTATAVQATWLESTNNTNELYMGVMATFRAASGAAATPRCGTLLGVGP